MGKHSKLRVFLVFIFIGTMYSFNAKAQGTTNSTNQLWTDFNPTWNIGERQKIIADGGYRLNLPHSWNRFVIRAGYQYRLYNFLFKNLKTDEDFSAGLGFFYMHNQNNLNSYEVRPYQGYKLSFFLNHNWKMRNYVRLEERFVSNADKTSGFTFRARYQIATDYYVRGKIYENGRGMYIPLSVEFFFNIAAGNTINDVLRVTPGLGYQFNSDFKMHATVGYHFTQYNRQGLNAVVYRISVFKTIF